MGFALNDFVTEGSDKGDFDVIKYAIRKLTDDVSPVIIELIKGDPILKEMGALLDIANLYCVIIEARHKQEAENGA